MPAQTKDEKMDDTKTRLCVTIDKEDFRILQQEIPWGIKNLLFTVICRDLAEKLKTNRKELLSRLLEETLTLEDFVNSLTRGQEYGSRQPEKDS